MRLEPYGPQALAAAIGRRPWIEVALLAALTLTINLTGNGRVSLWDRDEPRYAQCTREMQQSGDWIRPTFNGEPRHHKPVLIYWLMMIGTAVGGDNPFGARLVSALAGTASVLMIWGLGRRMLGAQIGRLAALVLATAPIMAIESKLATTDATLTCLLVGAQVALWKLNQRDSIRTALTFWALLGLSVLAKGPVGPVMITASAVVSWWWGGPTACWGRLRWRWGVPLLLAIVLPWYVAISVLTRGEFLRFSIGFQVVNRVAHGMEEHGAFPGYYLVTMLGLFYPWSALMPPALFAAWKYRRERPELGFLLGWIVGPWLVVECVQTKLVHYYLPAIPACALLVAWLLREVAADAVALRRWPLGRVGASLLVGIGLGLPIGLVALTFVLPAPMRGPILVTAAVVVVGTLYAIDRFRHGAAFRAAHVLAATWAVVVLLTSGWLLPSAEPYRVSRHVAEKLREWSVREAATPVLASFQEPSVIYHYGRPITTLHDFKDLHTLLDHEDAVISALRPADLRILTTDPRINIERIEEMGGFNVDKGRDETLQVSRITRRVGSTSGVARRLSEQVLIK